MLIQLSLTPHPATDMHHQRGLVPWNLVALPPNSSSPVSSAEHITAPWAGSSLQTITLIKTKAGQILEFFGSVTTLKESDKKKSFWDGNVGVLEQ